MIGLVGSGGVIGGEEAGALPGALLERCGVATAAIYFPGFHRSPDNDAFWGNGWTEWDHLRDLTEDAVTREPMRHPLRYYDIADDGRTLRAQVGSPRNHNSPPILLPKKNKNIRKRKKKPLC